MDVPTWNKTIEHAAFDYDNSSIDLAKAPKMRLGTKHVAIKHHHFQSHVQKR